MKQGTPITVVWEDGFFCTLTYAAETSFDDVDSFHVDDSSGPLKLMYSDEGSEWLRGHHLPESKEVDAARVAMALKSRPDR